MVWNYKTNWGKSRTMELPKYHEGVQVKTIYEVKELDNDFFEGDWSALQKAFCKLTNRLKFHIFIIFVKKHNQMTIKYPINNSLHEIFPTEERLKGEHVAIYLEKHKTIPQTFEKVKNKIKEW